MPYYADQWWDKPADRHNQGCNLSFADGHAERWRWKVAKTPAFPGQSLAPGEQEDYDRVQNAMRKYTDP
jgi:prepilin-type processing-associated H-X9-DG protein